MLIDSVLLHAGRRIAKPDLQKLIQNRSEETSAYICGPDNMITSISDCLKELGLSNIHFERWS